MQEKLSGTEEEARRKMEEMRVEGKEGGSGGEKVLIRVEESRPGAAAEAVKAADQALNNVGRS